MSDKDNTLICNHQKTIVFFYWRSRLSFILTFILRILGFVFLT